MSRESLVLLMLCNVFAGCAESTEAPANADTGTVGDSRDTTDDSRLDTQPALDTSVDTAVTDTAPSDSGAADTAATDTALADTTPTDTAPADPCTPLPSGLTAWTKTETASVGTPDTYFFDVTPGDPFCATITGGGSGTWSINVSNGTSSGVYCSGSSKCSIVVPAGQMTLLATAITTDIGGYTMTVHYRPR